MLQNNSHDSGGAKGRVPVFFFFSFFLGGGGGAHSLLKEYKKTLSPTLF